MALLDSLNYMSERLDASGRVVASYVPLGCPAYLRILNPAYDSNGKPVRWGTSRSLAASVFQWAECRENVVEADEPESGTVTR